MQREIDAAQWEKIRRNYSGPVAQTLEKLMALDCSVVTGRLLLLHGEPGTGKTTALRALAQQWRTWCQVDCVLDPERLFSDPAYLMSVALGSGDEDEPRWRLLMLEDCDELISGEAKAADLRGGGCVAGLPARHRAGRGDLGRAVRAEDRRHAGDGAQARRDHRDVSVVRVVWLPTATPHGSGIAGRH